MKVFLLIFLLASTGGQAACLQDSRILKDDLTVDIRKMENAADTFQQSMNSDLAGNFNLVIRLDTLNSRVNAEIIKQDNQLVIEILGGMLRHEVMSPDVLLLLLCHEIGHFLGGPPMKSRTGWSSTEGQSDFYSGAKCARTLGFNEAAFTEAAIALTQIYAEVGREDMPGLDRCDETTVERTNFGYPGAQCRLDTLMAGWVGNTRPRCWFKE